MADVKAFLEKKDIEISVKRYLIDALGAMAQGLFASLLMMLIGASFYDCPTDAVIAIRLFRLHQKPSDWAKVHRLAGICWMAAGLLQLIFLFAFDQVPAGLRIVPLILLLFPLPVAAVLGR